MAHWDDMTDKEREEYVNQDAVKLHSREVLCSFERFIRHCEAPLEEPVGLALVFAGSGYLAEDSVLYSIIDPVKMECLRLYYGEGQTLRQIAEAIKVQYMIGDRMISSKKLTKDIVWKNILSGRMALKKALGDSYDRAFCKLKELRSNQQTC